MRHACTGEMMPGQLGPTRRERDWVRRMECTRSMSCRGMCSATETIRGISASMAEVMAAAAERAGTKTAVGESGLARVWFEARAR